MPSHHDNGSVAAIPSLTRRHFTKDGRDAFATVEYARRDIEIKGHDGAAIFSVRGAEVPIGWSTNACSILASKYFRRAGVPNSTVIDKSQVFHDIRPPAPDTPGWLMPRVPSNDAVLGAETSVKQVVHRLAGHWAYTGFQHGYFSDEEAWVYYQEMVYALLHQMCAPNSPQWFSTGLFWAYGITGNTQGHHHCPTLPQQVGGGNPASSVTTKTAKTNYELVTGHACFLSDVDDRMMGDGGIFDWYEREGRIFRGGSGSGTNVSKLRGVGERLSSGGASSGAMGWMMTADRSAGAIKSGGTTRRAARMVIMDVDHPEIETFIDCKMEAEMAAAGLITGTAIISEHCQRIMDEVGRSAHGDIESALLHPGVAKVAARAAAAGVSHNYIAKAVAIRLDGVVRWPGKPYGNHYEGPAYVTVPYQNANHSVLIPRGFYGSDHVDLRARVTGKVVKTIKREDLEWRIAAATHFSGDPGVLWADNINDWNTTPRDGLVNTCNPCLGRGTRLATKDGLISVEDLDGLEPEIFDGFQFVKGKVWKTGHKAMVVVTTNTGHTLRVTPDHKLLTADGWMEAAECNGRVLPVWHGTADPDHGVSGGRHQGAMQILGFQHGNAGGSLPEIVFRADPVAQCSFLRGLFGATGMVADAPCAVSLVSVCRPMLQEVQMILQSIGIFSVLRSHDGDQDIKRWRLDIDHQQDINRFANLIGFPQVSQQKQLLRINDGGPVAARTEATPNRHFMTVVSVLPAEQADDVYDFTCPTTHMGVANGVIAHNCAEFLRPVNSACNLASLSMNRFVDGNGAFDVQGFGHVCELLTVTLDITNSMALLPCREIAANVWLFRDIGVGYAGLGSVLMRLGIPYDSGEGCAFAAAVTALMNATCHATSARIASRLGAYPRFDHNRDDHLRVAANHLHALKGEECLGVTVQPMAISWSDRSRPIKAAAERVYAEALAMAEASGFRNASVSLIAPTGTIGILMDADTTGVEPLMGLVTYKELAGGGMMKQAASQIGEGLRALGYAKDKIVEITAFVTSPRPNGAGDQGHIPAHMLADPGHASVFDCALPDPVIGRSLSPESHVRMLAAVQPHLSCGISKSVNAPSHTTIKQIADLYRMSHDLGVKANAIYRDGSKLSQPVTLDLSHTAAPTAKDVGDALASHAPMVRRELGCIRSAGIDIRVRMQVGSLYIRTTNFPDGQLGEVWVSYSADQGMIQGLISSMCRVMNIGLQFGVPPKALIESLIDTNFDPKGMVKGHPRIKVCKSVPNLIGRVLAYHVLDDNSVLDSREPTDGKTGDHKPDIQSRINISGEACPTCGRVWSYVINGNGCKKCNECGHSSGCGA